MQLYIALELCEASLGDLIERPKDLPELHKLFEPLDALRGMSEGLSHLHALGICHRDLTPRSAPSLLSNFATILPILIAPTFLLHDRNVLISRSSKRRTLVFKLGDFGLAKLVPPDQSSFTQTSATGTVGWRAPECLLDEHGGSRDASGWEIVGGDAGASATGASSRATSAIDVWSAGCLFFYTMTEGRHPLCVLLLLLPLSPCRLEIAIANIVRFLRLAPAGNASIENETSVEVVIISTSSTCWTKDACYER
jgi:serine/threonine-protein kinase/endoribonuclease IRE1